ncbi:BZ3500_MvSof-1268-A1-R1_Chr1-2g01455 [Microbotryum saponariae]|uniref:Large ribosomal subunit protein uL4m n=1 Tax=Microbotryum saponariae TaxID=289078 RepID=A0A2X0LML4_9BASI|nr:BZ3500_MvSof-1268-A1-R1_Chr1-2g01455 [Microbotryum saponariae]SCZ97463.1 BZ3501_MvSof-1269-A2-R1_Chr1-2g01054 [Microbotryum saponariae]
MTLLSLPRIVAAASTFTAACSLTGSARRTLATAADAVTLPNATAADPNEAATVEVAPAASLEQVAATPPPPPAPSKPVKQRLPSSTPPPTPYHPYVHVPLGSLFPSTSSSSSKTSDSPLLVPLPAPLFNAPSRPSLLHKLIVAHLASLRTGTAATKNRREVAYSGKKIRPQKGTGRARLGSRGSPMLKGGGRAFGKRPKGPDGWARLVNRKEERLGLSVGLSDKWRVGGLNVVERIGMDLISTRKLNENVLRKGWSDTLFILGTKSDPLELSAQAKFELSAGNLENLSCIKQMDQLKVWDIVKKRNVVVELDAVDDLIHRVDPEWAWEEEEFDDEDEWIDEEAPEVELGTLHGEQEIKQVV